MDGVSSKKGEDVGRLSGRVAVVTGAARGIGAAEAEQVIDFDAQLGLYVVVKFTLTMCERLSGELLRGLTISTRRQGKYPRQLCKLTSVVLNTVTVRKLLKSPQRGFKC